MTIFYQSRTGNVESFVDRFLDYLAEVDKELYNCLVFTQLTGENVEHLNYKSLKKPFALITHTTNFGQVPDVTSSFLQHIDNKVLKVVASSGNRNWGKNYAIAADLIVENYAPHASSMKFELRGLSEDFKKLYDLIIKELLKLPTHIYP